MFRHVPLTEKVLVFFLLIVIVVFSSKVYAGFHDENAYAVPADGGVYTEGLVGKITNLNPLLARSAADRDISRLIFSGLTRYNPSTGEIEEDLATYTLSSDKRVYSFILRDNLFWHDGEPLTVDDVIYTYKIVLQNPYFHNRFLQEAFRDIEIERISDKELRFSLATPYAFFLANVTTGILPKHILNLVPIEDLPTSDFNFHQLPQYEPEKIQTHLQHPLPPTPLRQHPCCVVSTLYQRTPLSHEVRYTQYQDLL